MNELDFELIKKKAKRGVLVLTSRTAILQVISLISTFLLTVLLKPEIFGIFFVVSAAVAFLSYFSDVGLAAALVQKKEEITHDDLKTTFTIQLILVLLIVVFALYFSSSLAVFYNLNNTGLVLLRALIIAFLFSSFKTIPSIILERKLEFNKFVIPQIIETLFFYITTVYLAWKGWGVASFSAGVLVRAVSGLIAIYIIVPWKPGLGINKESAKKLLNFGIPFQINSLLALIKDDLLTVYLGKALSFAEVGYIGWAKKWSEMSLRLVMDNINKVSFPTFSRLQHDKNQLQNSLEKVLFFVLLITFPAVISGIILIGPLVQVIPKYSKWLPAITSFYFFSFSVLFASVSSVLTNFIQSLGKVNITLKLMVLWTSLTWILIPIMIKIFGFNGVAISMFLISFTSIITLVIARRLVFFDLNKIIIKPIIVSLVMTFCMLVGKYLYPSVNLIQVIVILLSGGLSFIIVVYLTAKDEIKFILNK